MEYVPVIGLEVHAQLLTRSKIFCGCSTEFGAPPNHHTCPICLGMPGVLPVLNRRVVELAVRTGLALGCEIRALSQWARTNYFYPDLPKGYQISQYELPLCEHGTLPIDLPGGAGEKRVRIKRIHMEEDAGKNIHQAGGAAAGTSLVDFNRAGVPLVEIVSEPDLGSPEEASAYLKGLRDVLVTLGVCNGNMEQGSFRCDANVSVMPAGATELGTRTELKNINSFRFVREALDFEIKRQIEVLRSGGKVVQETRLYDPDARRTQSMRSKEEAHDYRYFPEPDLQPLRLDAGWMEEIRTGLPELPRDRMLRFERQYGLPREDAQALTCDVDPAVGVLFDEVMRRYGDAKKLANWFRGELFRALKDGEARLDELKLTSEAFAALLGLVDSAAISLNAAKEVFATLLKEGGDPAKIVEARGLRQVSDTQEIERVIDEVIAQHPDEATRYRSGKKQLLGFFTGQVMKAMKGKGNPVLVNQTLQRKLGSS
ncbi:MAG: Asp-tRNA(Asn)/Glu-tRNA(Gln) amidotransferase subunit GatB [Deltaproteobacteria bacterium]|nr:Asp-tRNA(Asn)/Glu-tRNA(Gln) amidotransferase subunit GatB [Deltaproteobacteria bacterium]